MAWHGSKESTGGRWENSGAKRPNIFHDEPGLICAQFKCTAPAIFDPLVKQRVDISPLSY